MVAPDCKNGSLAESARARAIRRFFLIRRTAGTAVGDGVGKQCENRRCLCSLFPDWESERNNRTKIIANPKPGFIHFQCRLLGPRPEGTTQLSPARQRWDSNAKMQVPEG